MSETTQCPACNGSKECHECEGDGMIYATATPFSQEGRYVPCTKCAGSGKCPACGGTGVAKGKRG